MQLKDLDLIDRIMDNCKKLRENLEKEIEEIEGRKTPFPFDENNLKFAKKTLELIQQVINYFSG